MSRNLLGKASSPASTVEKGFEELTPEAQKAVKATLAPFFEVPRLREKPLAA